MGNHQTSPQTKLFASGVAALLLSAAALTSSTQAISHEQGQADLAPLLQPSVVRSQLSALPLSFEKNQGQSDPRVQFLSRGSHSTLFLTSTEAVVVLSRNVGPSDVQNASTGADGKPVPRPCKSLDCIRQKTTTQASASPSETETQALRLKWVNANEGVEAAGIDPLPGKSNYLIGNDASQWHTGVPLYSRVRYSEMYPGIDLVYYENRRALEFDFVVAPGAHPSAIAFDVEGAQSIATDEQGHLAMSLGGEEVRLLRPEIYQETSQGRRAVEGSYKLVAKNRVALNVGDYDKTIPLVIDPVLTYSTYLGGTGYDEIDGVAVDTDGNIYVAGVTLSTDFPTAAPLRATTNGADDAFVAKISADGSQLIYSTYLGGNGSDTASGIAVDATGTAYVGGYTLSTNFPIFTPYQAAIRSAGTFDAFAARLNSAGSALMYSTYLGGSSDDAPFAVALDSAGSFYLAGQTASTNFPLLNSVVGSRVSAIDGFVTKLSSAGNTLIFSTYLGGNNDDGPQGLAADGAGNAYITGYTRSSNFQRVNFIQGALGGGTCTDGVNTFPCSDAFVTKIASAGSQIVYSTYLGGNGEDQGEGIAVDSQGNAYVSGFAASSNFPTATPIQSTLAGETDVFVTKLNAAGTAIAYSTYLGGLLSDDGSAIAVDSAGSAIVAGNTSSSAFPVVNSIQGWNGDDVFVSKLSPAGSSLMYSTFLGGTDIDFASAIALDTSGNAYVGGGTISDDFPVRSPLQAALKAGTCVNSGILFPCPDGYVAKLIVNPGLFANGVVNGASFTPGAPVAPGSIVSGFGSDITGAVGLAGSIPLPMTLNGVSIRANATAAPLFYVSGNQENFQIPWEMAGQTQASIVATANGVALPPVTVNIAPTAPGIFSTNSSGSGQGAIMVAGTTIFAAPTDVLPGSRPASRTETVSIFCTGLGDVQNRPPTGSALPGGNGTVIAPVNVTIGGIGAQVTFNGLAPGFVGLYQVNAVVPANVPTGAAIPVVLSAGGVISNTVTIAVQ